MSLRISRIRDGLAGVDSSAARGIVGGWKVGCFQYFAPFFGIFVRWAAQNRLRLLILAWIR